MESRTQIKSYNVISVKINPSILNDFLDINLSQETKNKIIKQGYEQARLYLQTKSPNLETCSVRKRSASI